MYIQSMQEVSLLFLLVAQRSLAHDSGVWEAAQLGNVGRLRSILDRGTNVNVRDESGYTPLHYACRAGKAEVVIFLLKNGVCFARVIDVNTTKGRCKCTNVWLQSYSPTPGCVLRIPGDS